MGRYIAELGLTPSSRSRVGALQAHAEAPEPIFVTRYMKRPEGEVPPDGDPVVRVTYGSH